MGLFDGFQTSRAIGNILESRPTAAEHVAGAERLRSLGRSALPKILEALPRDRHGTLTRIVADLASNTTMQVIVAEGLLSEDQQLVAAVKRALHAGTNYDVNRLLDTYASGGGSLVNISDILMGRKETLTAKSLMRILQLAKEDGQPALLKLVDQLASEQMVPMMIGFLKSAEADQRAQITQTISRFKTEGVRDTLVNLLADPDKNVRRAALDGVTRLGMPVPPGPVCALLRDPDMLVQSKAIDAAIKLNDPASIRHLIEVLQDESEHARRAAVEVLNVVGSTNAIKDLLFALKDKDWWVRVRAADALGAIGGPKVIDAVLQLLGDGDEFLRRTAIEILNTTKDERAFQHLVVALRDKDWWVRERAIDALSNLGDKRAIEHLVAILPEGSQATPVAIRALAQLNATESVPQILATLAHGDAQIQREAIEAVRMLAAEAQMEQIEAALGSFEPASTELRDGAQRVATELATRFRRGASHRRLSTASVGVPSPAAARRTLYASGGAMNDPESVEIEPTLDASLDTLAIKGAMSGGSAGAKQSSGSRPTPQGDAGDGASGTIDFGVIEPGQVLGGRYKVLRELGRGGFGTVLHVEDQMVGEEIALKLINPSLVQDESVISRFVHEARYARKITHENVIRIHDFMMVGRNYAISMEYFASHSLARHIRRGLHREPARALKFARDIARGMHVAHQASIMHRDLKPANILVNEADELKIVDFGLSAACSAAESRVTRTGHLVGTPTYMSPEQARGLNVDTRTDIYSLGVIMYEMFTGTPPYTADNPLTVLYLHLEGKKEPPRARNPDIPPAVEAVILKAMSVKPEDRYASAAEMLAALDALDLREAA